MYIYVKGLPSSSLHTWCKHVYIFINTYDHVCVYMMCAYMYTHLCTKALLFNLYFQPSSHIHYII